MKGDGKKIPIMEVKDGKWQREGDVVRVEIITALKNGEKTIKRKENQKQMLRRDKGRPVEQEQALDSRDNWIFSSSWGR